MSRVFVDTSALYALLISSDKNHAHAARVFRSLQARTATLLTTSYVLVETYALLGKRVGLEAVASFREDFQQLLEITWVGPELHERGLALLLNRRRRDLSLVDAVSFVAIRDNRVENVFTYDPDFAREGFSTLE
jgi:predicted nucleic acid-binding protein